MNEQAGRWHIHLTQQAEQTLRRLPQAVLQRLDPAILALTNNPHPPESRVLVADDNLYGLIVDNWRIIYAIEAEQLTILILEIAVKQQPKRYHFDEMASEGFLPANISHSEEAAWYIIFTYRLDEMDKVRNNLRHRVDALGLQDKIFQVVIVEQSVLPGFLLVEMILDDDSWYVVRNTPGVTGWLGAEGKPTPIRPDNIDDIVQAKVQETKILKILQDQFSEGIIDAVEAHAGHSHQPKTRVLIASDRPDDREALQRMLFFEADIDVVGAIDNDETVIEKTIKLVPDIIVLNIPSHYSDDFEVCRQLHQKLSSTSIIVMSVFGDGHFLRQAMLAGAKYTLIKPFSSDELVKAIRQVGNISAASSRGDFEAFFLRRGGGSLLKRIEMQRQGEEDRAKDIEMAPQWLKIDKLGRHVEISLAVADLSTSLAFYKKLGLEPVDGGEKPYPWATFSNGTFHLGLHQQAFPSPTITYFTSNVSEVVHFLKKFGVAVETVRDYSRPLGFEDSLIVSADFEAHDGQRVALANKFIRLDKIIPKRKFLAGYDKSIELSLPTINVNAAVAYWQRLGFEPVASSHTPYTWTVISDGLIRLGLHQTTKFTKPTITYFASDMPDRLDCLEQQGIALRSEHRDAQGQRVGAVIESPDGQPFFLFAGKVE